MHVNTDRIDIHQHAEQLQHELARLANDTRLQEVHRRTIARFISDARCGRLGGKRQRKRLSDGRCLKYLFTLRRFAFEVAVPFEAVTPSQMERFVFGLEDGSIRKLVRTGGTDRYAGDSVNDFKKLLRRFYRWLLGPKSARFHALTGWFDTADQPPELHTFGLDDARQMAEAMESIQGNALVMAWFDGGFRSSEAMNLRLHDVTFRTVGDTERLAFVRVRYSKTKPRTIPLPLASRALVSWIRRHPQGGEVLPDGTIQARDPSALLFVWSYDTIRRKFREVGMSVLQERVYPYRCRHASATFYAPYLTEYQMCARYGWVMGSDSVRRYVDHSGILTDQMADVLRTRLMATHPSVLGEDAQTISPLFGAALSGCQSHFPPTCPPPPLPMNNTPGVSRAAHPRERSEREHPNVGEAEHSVIEDPSGSHPPPRRSDGTASGKRTAVHRSVRLWGQQALHLRRGGAVRRAV